MTMIKDLTAKAARAYTISICSGKGGVGKSTLAMLIASRIAETDRRVLLIDADFGIGDIATIANLQTTIGFDELLRGNVKLQEAALKIGPRLWVIGSSAGNLLDPTEITGTGLDNCSEADSVFDVVIIDTPSTLDPFILSLIGGSDLALTVTTSRIPAIADSYIQLKQIVMMGSRAKHCFAVNRVESEADGQQTIIKFAELVEKFMNMHVSSIGMIDREPRIEMASENQSLLEYSRQQGALGRKAEKTIKALLEQYIEKGSRKCSIWEHLKQTIGLKNVPAFDDTEALVRV
jgi:flagellar biosynthesis protein FlhG